MIRKFCGILFLLFTQNVFSSEIEHDTYGRLKNYPDKIEISCPSQTNKTGVILAIGQSNIANHAQSLMKSRFPDKVFNYYNGKCYLASSPLLGATGEGGEFLTPLGDYLIEMGVYDNVVIISSGIGATPISLWKEGGELNNMLMKILEEVKKHYSLTEILWHQGEADFIYNTSGEEYKNSFASLIKSLRKDNKKIPFHYAVATKCIEPWSADNQISRAQKELINNDDKIYLAVDTDSLLLESDRYYGCHLLGSGLYKTAYGYANSIINAYKK